jgi:hypothetical protein
MKFRSMGPLSPPSVQIENSNADVTPSVIRKQLAGLVITPRVGHLDVFGRVLNILVSDPVLHKLEFASGIEQMRGERMLETMEFPPLRRQTRLLGVTPWKGQYCTLKIEIPNVISRQINVFPAKGRQVA